MNKILIFLVMLCFSCSISFADEFDAEKEKRYQEFKRKEDKAHLKYNEELEFSLRMRNEKLNKEQINGSRHCLNRVRKIGNDDIKKIAYAGTVEDINCIEQLGSTNQKNILQKEQLEARECSQFIYSDWSGFFQHPTHGLVDHEYCIEQSDNAGLKEALKKEKMTPQSQFEESLAQKRLSHAKWREEAKLRYGN
jgi:hypothetical protein